MASTSEIMRFIAAGPIEVTCHVVEDEDFYVLYRTLITCLQGASEDASSEGLRFRQSTWSALARMLLSPLEFNDEWQRETAQCLSSGRTYGAHDSYDAAVDASVGLCIKGNPLRARCRNILLQARAQQAVFKVFCHRTERACFAEAVPEISWQDDQFIHSRAQYAASAPHDVLVRVGPLRATGRGRVPDALVTAPRSRRLEVVHWAVSRHDADFGMSATGELPPRIRTLRSGAQLSLSVPDVDILVDIASPAYSEDPLLQTALIILDESRGCLVPAHGEVWALEGLGRKPEVRRVSVHDELAPGMWLVVPELEMLGASGVKATAGPRTEVWKKALREEYYADRARLLVKLHTHGIQLTGVEGAVRHWIKEPTTVIHAPQSKQHFALLLRVLGIVPSEMSLAAIRKTAEFREGWGEIARSRGKAIEAGVLESELEREALGRILETLAESVREQCGAQVSWAMEMPDNAPVTGHCEFHIVRGVEAGYRAPESALRVIVESEKADVWRS